MDAKKYLLRQIFLKGGNNMKLAAVLGVPTWVAWTIAAAIIAGTAVVAPEIAVEFLALMAESGEASAVAW